MQKSVLIVDHDAFRLRLGRTDIGKNIIRCDHKEQTMPNHGTEDDTSIKQNLQPPRMFRVTILNDDFTPQEFVVDVLKNVFRKDTTESTSIMMQVHTKGSGIAGVFTRDIAETKAEKVIDMALTAGHPLIAIATPEGS